MARFLVSYLAAGAAFLVLDFVWLTLVAKNFYRSEIGELMLAEPKLGVITLFYLLYVFGLLIFTINPAVKSGDWKMAVGMGAAFGLVAYATYDLTNLGTLRGWSMAVSLVDMGWGTFVSAVASGVGYWAAIWYGNR